MTEVLKSGPSFEVSFRGELPFVLTGALSILGTAADYEGFDQWIYVTYAALSDELRKDITLLFVPLGIPLILRCLLDQNPDLSDLTSFVGWLSLIDDRVIREHVASTLDELAKKAGGDSASAPAVDDDAGLRDFLLQTTKCAWTDVGERDPVYFDQLVWLMGRPDELKARLVFTVTRFWEAHYASEYDETRRLIERSVAYHNRLRYSERLDEVYVSVTGKALSSHAAETYAQLERLTFVPSCYAGPYAQFIGLDAGRRNLVLIYNCRPRSGNEDDPNHLLPALFPPLKALADETRLEILAILADGELYAQQIVDRLEISQPAVSRHLRLMVAVGILAERRENGMKFYQVRQETLSGLAQRIATLAAQGSDEA